MDIGELFFCFACIVAVFVTLSLCFVSLFWFIEWVFFRSRGRDA